MNSTAAATKRQNGTATGSQFAGVNPEQANAVSANQGKLSKSRQIGPEG